MTEGEKQTETNLVFLTEGRSKNLISDSEPEKPKIEGVVSIENFQSLYPTGIPVFTEEETISAMKKLGITADELKYPSDGDYAGFPDVAEVRKHVETQLLERRNKKIQLISNVRNLIIKRKSHQDLDTNRPVSEKINHALKEMEERDESRLIKLQQKEIESLIISELMRQKMIKQEQERIESVQQAISKRKEEHMSKINEEVKRRKEKELKVLERIEQREKEIVEKQQQRESEAETRKKAEQEEQRQRRILANQAEIERLKKIDNMKMQLEKQLKEEQAKAALKELEIKKREEDRVMQNQKEQEEHKTQIIKRMSEGKKRAEHNTLRERQLLEEKRNKIFEKEMKAKERLDLFQNKKRQTIESSKKKNYDDSEKHHKIAEKLKQDMENKRESILEKQEKHYEKLAKLQEMKKQKIIQAQEEEEKRIREVIEKREQALKEQAAIQEKLLKKYDEDTERVNLVKKEHEIEILKKAATTRLKTQITEENAKFLQKQKEIMLEDKILEKEEREAKALAKVDLKRRLGQKRKEAMIQSIFKKQTALSEFREILSQGGEPDIEALAKRFNLDIDELRQKVDTKETLSSLPKLKSGPASNNSSPASTMKIESTLESSDKKEAKEQQDVQPEKKE